MKAIILAAGEGKRMYPLTLEKPKPMLPIAGKPILEYIIESLPSEIDEILLVVGYKREQIVEYFKDRLGPFPILYIVQHEAHGTFHALRLCQPYLRPHERFLLLYGDDIMSARSLRLCTTTEGLTMLARRVRDPHKFGVLELGANGFISSIEEKPENPKSNLVSLGAMTLSTHIFGFRPNCRPNSELVLADSVAAMINAGHRFRSIETDIWIPVGTPKELAKAEESIVKYRSDICAGMLSP